MAMTATYTRRTPEQSIFHKAFKKQWPVIRAQCRAANDGHGLPVFIEKAADNYLRCGMLKHGFVYAKCDRCAESIVIALSCKQRGWCNSNADSAPNCLLSRKIRVWAWPKRSPGQ